jgi:membrane fusion protein (multidrug efflux system)
MSSSNETAQKSNKFKFVFIILVLVSVLFGTFKILHSMAHEETDDAQIEMNISPIIPRVSGYISEIKVKDNQTVKKGDTLLIIDNRDFLLKLRQAEAALDAANGNESAIRSNFSSSTANLAATEAGGSSLRAQIESAKIKLWRAAKDYERYGNLVRDHTISQQKFEQAQAEKETAERQLEALQEQKKVIDKQVHAANAQSQASNEQIKVGQAMIEQREADVQNALLNLSYTVITAPCDGQVSKINAQIGQLVQAGQALFSVVANDEIWVVANFKETQLNKMNIGQHVMISVDGLNGLELKGKVHSFSPATGAKFALLPPDNASGNFVKTVQRIPVKIVFEVNQKDAIKRLRAGMNVMVDVTVK